MLRSEFDALIETRIPTDGEYEIIEKVYNYHPSISPVYGKSQVAALWESLGILPFEDMLPRAEMCMEIENEIQKLRYRIKDLEKIRDMDAYYPEVSWIDKTTDKPLDLNRTHNKYYDDTYSIIL